MARRKLKHFDEMKGMAHVFEPTLAWQKGEPLNLKGSWGERVILELACGRGDYTLGLAERFPDSTVVGVDIKGSRMWFGARKATDMGLTNARFLRTQIERLADYFEEGEVDEIWITFPNPHPTEGNAKRRLTSPRFLKMYKQLLKTGGQLHLKTDDPGLYAYTLETLPAEGFTVQTALDDVYAAEGAAAILTEVQTQYEKRYLSVGKPIKYVRAK